MADLDYQFQRTKSNPTAFRWAGSFTGNVTLSLPVPRGITKLDVSQLAATTPGADHFTYVYSASREKKDEVTIYAWLNNAAAVVATEVEIIAHTD